MLRILSVAFPFAPVGPPGVGGAERILADLDRALSTRAEQSVVIACEGSQICGELLAVPVCLQRTVDEAAQREARNHVQSAIETALSRYEFDVVHMHGLDFYKYSIPPDIPVVVTLHMPISWYPAEAWRFREPVQYCCVSSSQHNDLPERLSGVVIENGVSLSPFHPMRKRKDFALVLGRICPEKNAHEALEAGTRAGVSVWLAGRVYPYREHQRYFAERIQPLLGPQLNGVQHRFLGPLSRDALQPLLASARCLLHPTLAPETSSLVAMEALAAGTPVIAYPSGALPEVIRDGITGYLVNSIEDMVRAIRHVAMLSPEACREAAESRFDVRRMAREYLGLYALLAQANQAEPLHA